MPQLNAPLRSGLVLGGRFRVEDIIHRSGMSTVYRASDQRHQGTLVAVKEFCATSLTASERAEALAWLAREAALLSTLNNPHLPRLLAAFSEGDRHYVVMPYLTGETLEERIRREGPQPESLVLAWGTELADLLSFLHSQDPPVVHRDLKPANVLLRPNGSLTLLDLGVARVLPRPAQGTPVPGTAVGTPGYAPPEQYQGLADERSDLYALGATLHRALTGYDPEQEPPFRQPPVRSLAPAVGEDTERLVAALLQVAPEQRPAGPQAVLGALAGAMRGAVARAYQPVQRTYFAVLGLLVVALALGAWLYQVCYGQPLIGNAGTGFEPYEPIGDPARILLVFAPGALPFLPLLDPRFRRLARTHPAVALCRDWLVKLLLFCWLLPAAAWLVGLYRQRWGNLAASPGQGALLLALSCALLAAVGIGALRFSLYRRPLRAARLHWPYLALGGLVLVWPLSAAASSPRALNLCYVAPTQDSVDLGNWLPVLATDRSGDVFALDQDGLQERMANGAIRVLVPFQALNAQADAKPLNLLAVSPDGAVVLGASGGRSLYTLSRSGALRKLLSLPGPGLPDRTSLAVGVDGRIYYADLATGSIYVVRAGQAPVALEPYPPMKGWHPQALATDDRGDLYFLDIVWGVVGQISPGGRLRTFSVLHTPGFGTSGQATLTWEPDGTLYTADGTTLLKITATGHTEAINSTDGIFQAVAVPAHRPRSSKALSGTGTIAAQAPLEMTAALDGADGSGVSCLL